MSADCVLYEMIIRPLVTALEQMLVDYVDFFHRPVDNHPVQFGLGVFTAEQRMTGTITDQYGEHDFVWRPDGVAYRNGRVPVLITYSTGVGQQREYVPMVLAAVQQYFHTILRDRGGTDRPTSAMTEEKADYDSRMIRHFHMRHPCVKRWQQNNWVYLCLTALVNPALAQYGSEQDRQWLQQAWQNKVNLWDPEARAVFQELGGNVYMDAGSFAGFKQRWQESYSVRLDTR